MANGAQFLKEHQKAAMQHVKEGAEACEGFQDQPNCCCKVMLLVVKEAACVNSDLARAIKGLKPGLCTQ